MEKNELRARLNNYARRKNNKTINSIYFILPFLFILFLIWTYFWIRSHSLLGHDVFTIKNILISLFFSSIAGAVSVLLNQYRYEMMIGKYRTQLIMLEMVDAKEDVDEDIYENLIKISYKYLDEYYLQTRQQAQKGFVVTVAVSIMGAFIVAIGIGTMFFGKTTPAYVTTAAGVITEFISAVFFYLYNRTISSMSDYHNKLVLSQNVSIALKIAESLSTKEGAKVKSHIVTELVKDINTFIHSEGAKNKQK